MAGSAQVAGFAQGDAPSADSRYSLQGIYFSRGQYTSTADCLTAAYARRLPLALCR